MEGGGSSQSYIAWLRSGIVAYVSLRIFCMFYSEQMPQPFGRNLQQLMGGSKYMCHLLKTFVCRETCHAWISYLGS